MLAFNFSPEWAYVHFASVVYLIMLLIWWQKPDLRSQMNFMSLCGAVGGLVVGACHQVDFWNPPSWGDGHLLGLRLSPWDMVFGGAFTGITTTLLQLFGGKRLVAEEAVSVMFQRRRRKHKVIYLALIILVGSGCYFLLWLNTLASAIVAYTYGAWLLHRHGGLRTALHGGLLTLVAYSLIVGVFVAVAGNRVELAMTMCQFYVKHGALGTGVMLALFAFSYGAMVAPLYGWITNQRFVDTDWPRH